MRIFFTDPGPVWCLFSDYISQPKVASNFFRLKFSAVSVFFFLRTRLKVDFGEKLINLRHRLPVSQRMLHCHSMSIPDRPSEPGPLKKKKMTFRLMGTARS